MKRSLRAERLDGSNGPPGTVTIKRRVFALGQTWTDAHTDTEAEQHAITKRAVAYTYRPTASQVGLSLRAEHKAGMWSGAVAAMAAEPADDWAACLALPSTGNKRWYWFLTVRKRKVVDDAVISEDEAHVKVGQIELLQEAERVYEKIYAEPEMEVEGSVEQRLDVLLAVRPGQAKLRNVGVLARFIPRSLRISPQLTLAIVLLVAAIGGGTWLYNALNAVPPPRANPNIRTPAEKRQVAEAAAAAARAAKASAPLPPPPMPVSKPVIRPDPAWFAAHCTAELGRLIADLGESNVADATCAPPVAGGDDSWTATVTAKRGGVATITARLHVDPAAVLPDRPSGLRRSTIISYLTEELSPVGVSLTTSHQPMPAAPGLATTAEAATVKNPETSDGPVVLAATLPPTSWMRPLQRLPANIIQLTFAGGKWTYQLEPR